MLTVDESWKLTSQDEPLLDPESEGACLEKTGSGDGDDDNCDADDDGDAADDGNADDSDADNDSGDDEPEELGVNG